VNKFIDKHADKITGTVSTFDRLLVKGYLPLGFPEAMERFMNSQDVLLKDFKTFAKEQSAILKKHAEEMAADAGRPFIYLTKKTRKEQLAHEIARRDKITQGLICVLSVVERCQSFTLRYGQGRPHLKSAQPPGLCLYFYYIDREMGFMHIRLQTWLPFVMQVYVNGHEWLARALDRRGVRYEKIENAFVHIDDCELAQHLADSFVRLKWQKILNAFARRVNPLLKTLLYGRQYYWIIDQSEYATDIIFKDRSSLKDLYKNLQRHAAVCFGAEDIMTFMGRRLNGNFQGEIASHYKKRWPGARIKHWMKANWIKMYDKFGSVLRIETVINHPYEFPIRRWGIRNGQRGLGWFPMAKRITNMYRYAEVSLAANSRYIDALAVVDDPTQAYRLLDTVCEPATNGKRRRRGLNPLRRDDVALFCAVMHGEHFIRGFTNRDLTARLAGKRPSDPDARKRQSARTTRLIQVLRAHGLIAKIPRSRRYRITLRGVSIMGAAIHLKEEALAHILKIFAA
jgi:hypothetical protein